MKTLENSEKHLIESGVLCFWIDMRPGKRTSLSVMVMRSQEAQVEWKVIFAWLGLEF